MKTMRDRTRLTIEGVNAFRVIDKLKRAEIVVYAARYTQKNEIQLEVDGKELKKVFAILQGSCYNVKKGRFCGVSRFWKMCLRSVGLFTGAALFALAVVIAQTRVLQISVTGSGAYYEAEVLSILSDNGIERFGALPRETAQCTAQILSLPRVSFCSFRSSGGILTVDVQVSDENAALSVRSLYAPAAGKVEELVVVRGTACVAVGDEVSEGDPVVESRAVYGEELREVIVIARVKISFSVYKEYEGNLREAKAQALLDYGEITDFNAERIPNGWLVTGTAYAGASVNFE